MQLPPLRRNDAENRQTPQPANAPVKEEASQIAQAKEPSGKPVKTEPDKAENGTVKLINAPKLLETLWDAECRPSLRSLRSWTSARIVPCVKIGGLTYYDVGQVRAAIARRTVNSVQNGQVQGGPPRRRGRPRKTPLEPKVA